ncbi:MAG: hypothetical protein JST39_25355 [Bacteroidetes bacterium]|nr:hypothetical protein [Bacteroidota bacterium]
MKLFYPTVYKNSACIALRASALFALCLSLLQPSFAQSGAEVTKNYNRALLDVHPLPGQLFINVKHPVSGSDAQLMLVDANGKTIQQVGIDRNSAQTKLSIEKLAPGTYRIKWSDGGKTLEQPLLML